MLLVIIIQLLFPDVKFTCKLFTFCLIAVMQVLQLAIYFRLKIGLFRHQLYHNSILTT